MAEELKKLRQITKLYGRSEEFSILLDTYNRVALSSLGEENGDEKTEQQCSSELVLVSGYSGTGKSSLVEKLRDHHLDRKELSLFLSGKFELLRRSEPYSAIVGAFSNFFKHLIRHESSQEETPEGNHEQRTRKVIQENVDEDSLQILVGLIPLLGKFMKGGTSSRRGSSVEGRNIAFRSLVHALSTVSRPLVLFYDDLQWADPSSLELLKALVLNDGSKGVLFVGTYRVNEVDHTHPLALILREIESSDYASIVITKIQISNLLKDTVNDLVADLLGMETSDTTSLTAVVYDRTQGNVFFVIRFLESLNDEGLLEFSLGLFKWQWDADRIRSDTSISDNVVDLMATKIRKKLSEEERLVLTFAACFGSHFDAEWLQLFLKTRKKLERGFSEDKGKSESKESDSRRYLKIAESLDENLSVAIEEGLVERDSIVTSSTSYRFAHDRIHQAAYSLVPQGTQREQLHLQIGDFIRQQRNLALEQGDATENTDWMLFVATDQLNIGSNQYSKEDVVKRRALAKLNAEAGQKAMQSSAFVPAASYLNKGINLLDHATKWSDDYDLTLQLYNASTAAEYRCSHFDVSRQRADEIVVNARSLSDKTSAIYGIVKILRNERKWDEGFEFCMSINAQYGQRIPTSKTLLRTTLKAELHIVKRMLRRTSDLDIQQLPVLKDMDERGLFVQFTGALMGTVCHRLLRYDLMALSSVRSVHHMLRNGVSVFSTISLVGLGSIFCGRGELQEGARCDKLAMSVVERLGLQNSWQPTIDYYSCTCIRHWIKGNHLQACLDPLLKNYTACIMSGDIYVGFGSVQSYAFSYLSSGLPLEPIEADLRDYCHKMEEYKQDAILDTMQLVWQYVQNLMGMSIDPVKLTGNITNQEDALKLFQRSNDQMAMAVMTFLRLDLAYYFGDMDLAASLAEAGRFYSSVFEPFFLVCRCVFMDGLVSLALARGSSIRHARRVRFLVSAKRAMKRIENWVRAGSSNVLHMLLLLQAENESLKKGKKLNEVKMMYDEAIATAGRNGFVQDKALASELAGKFVLYHRDNWEKDDTRFWASTYLTQAHGQYFSWGAKAKANQMLDIYGDLISSVESKEHISPGLRGRSRFTDPTTSHRNNRYSTGLDRERSLDEVAEGT